MWVRIQLVNGQSQKPASDHYYWPPELGTDGFGLGETRDDLRNYFEISADYIIQAALAEMYKSNRIDKEKWREQQAGLDINIEKSIRLNVSLLKINEKKVLETVLMIKSRLHAAIADEKPLQCVGVMNAYHARMAAATGFKALYLSGGGVAAGSCGIPDLGITTMDDVLTDLRRITAVTGLPVLVDIDTGWGSAFNINRGIRAVEQAGAAAVHIEDQVQQKRCGHRPNKAIVTKTEMVDRIKAAVDARRDDAFGIMARTDALANEGLPATIDRLGACVEAGADMVFPEAVTELKQYRELAAAVSVPVLANITEFGSTPLFTTRQLLEVDVSIALYPLSAFRSANQAALNTFRAIRRDGGQKTVMDTMQTREELYDFLNYHAYEQKLDELFTNPPYSDE